ncbi:Hypothetical predicted protein [Pelobates cultripes]|uniref:Uncharacterized protein n=1 Tax=Pelobates cultripes TaxID=61616 RepID=A0AAD1WE95_PELCU|nr:Hypothetical predicted protein [Pelobates cultripes]
MQGVPGYRTGIFQVPRGSGETQRIRSTDWSSGTLGAGDPRSVSNPTAFGGKGCGSRGSC